MSIRLPVRFCFRCGSTVSYYGNRAWCPRCLAYRNRTKPGFLERLENALRSIIRPQTAPRSNPRNAPRRPQPVIRAVMIYCRACGAASSVKEAWCWSCGKPLRPAPRATISEGVIRRTDEDVYRYIVEHGGEISISRASSELRMKPDDIRLAISKLEQDRRLAVA